jgi:hypothetical protein
MRRLSAAVSVVLLSVLTGSGYAVQVVSTFTDLSTKLIGGAARDYTTDFVLTNNTHFLWTDFHLTDLEPIGSLQPGFYTGPGSALSSVDANQHAVVDISGLSAPIGTSLSFTVRESCVGEICSLGGTIWNGGPAGIPSTIVPEPSAFGFLALGIAFAGLMIHGKVPRQRS